MGFGVTEKNMEIIMVYWGFIGITENTLETAAVKWGKFTPFYCSSFHLIFHCPYITPIYYSNFHFLFYYPKSPSMFR